MSSMGYKRLSRTQDVKSGFSRVGSSSNMSVLDSGMTTGKKTKDGKRRRKERSRTVVVNAAIKEFSSDLGTGQSIAWKPIV